MTYRKKHKDPECRGGFADKSEGIRQIYSFRGLSQQCPIERENVGLPIYY